MAGTVPYAALEDLRQWLGCEPPDDGQRLLARATEQLDSALVGVTYDVGVDGMPTLASVISAFNRATCAQVEFWIQSGDEFGEQANIAAYSIEGIAVTFRRPVPRLAPRARDILRVAGLLPSQTPIHMP